jgi:hypothetical protein
MAAQTRFRTTAENSYYDARFLLKARPPPSCRVLIQPPSVAPKLGTGAGDNQIDGLAVAFGIDQPLARLGSGIFSPYAVPIRQGPGWRGGRV